MEYTITLTKQEIEILQICLSGTALDLELEAERLERHNLTQINTTAINQKRARKKDCDDLWQKLYDATKIS